MRGISGGNDAADDGEIIALFFYPNYIGILLLNQVKKGGNIMDLKYKAKKDVSYSELDGWEDFGVIPKGTVCDAKNFHRFLTIFYNGKSVCDVDSQMAKDCFETLSA